MKSIFQTALLAALALSPLAGQAQDFRQYEDRPVTVIDRSTGGNQSVMLSGIEGNDLVFMMGGGQVLRPIDDPNLQLFFPTPEQTRRADAFLRTGRPEEALNLIRPVASPLLKYMRIPNERFNIHEEVRIYYEAAVRAGAEQEALYISRQLPLAQLDPIFTGITFQLAGQIASAGRPKDAMAIMERLPINENNPDLLPLVLNFAEQLREENLIAEALFLYQRLQAIQGSEVERIATIWNAYCNLRLGNKTIAKVIIESVEGIPSDDPAFSLYLMVNGRILLEEEQYVKALTNLSQGVVYGQLSDGWMPELLFNTGVCYAALDQPGTAREVFRELEIFYPKTNWAQKAKERVSRLPKES